MEAKAGTPESPYKMASLPFLKTDFLTKSRRLFMQRIDAPSMALCVMEKWQDFLFLSICKKKKVPQEKNKDIYKK